MHDIIVIGDSKLDTFLEINEASVHCNLDKSKCFLCLNYADKIPVTRVQQSFGGNAANFSVGVARLGIRTALYTVLGGDEAGTQVWNNFKKENVSTDYITRDESKNTSCSTIINFQGERTILTYHENEDYKLPQLQPVPWVYLTSVNFHHDALHAQVLEYVRNARAKMIFNPGTAQLRDGIEQLKNILQATEVLLLNKEEAELLLGKKPVPELLKSFCEYGVKISIITDAERGSFAFDGSELYEVPAQKVSLVERTGAGDAYAAGFVAARIKGLGLREAMEWGARNAASVVQHVGAQQGLLRDMAFLEQSK